MNIRRSSSVTVIAAVLAAVTLAGCSTTLAGSPVAGASAPTSQDTSTPSTDDSSSSESVDVTTESTDNDVLPPIDPSLSSIVTTEDNGGQTGGDLDADSITWLTTFCSGFSDITQYGAPDTTGMSADAEVQTIVDAYDAMSSAADSLATQLAGPPQPTFPDAVIMESAIITYLHQITNVYGMGAQQIANQTITTEDQLTTLINGIEGGMQQPTADLGTAMSSVNPSVQNAMLGIPECQFLGGGGGN